MHFAPLQFVSCWQGVGLQLVTECGQLQLRGFVKGMLHHCGGWYWL
jgi:hypothetical protein